MQHGVYHTVLKLIKLTSCFCSLTTPAKKTDAGWTLEIVQHMFNVYIVNMLKAPDESVGQNC